MVRREVTYGEVLDVESIDRIKHGVDEVAELLSLYSYLEDFIDDNLEGAMSGT